MFLVYFQICFVSFPCHIYQQGMFHYLKGNYFSCQHSYNTQMGTIHTIILGQKKNKLVRKKVRIESEENESVRTFLKLLLDVQKKNEAGWNV